MPCPRLQAVRLLLQPDDLQIIICIAACWSAGGPSAVQVNVSLATAASTHGACHTVRLLVRHSNRFPSHPALVQAAAQLCDGACAPPASGRHQGCSIECVTKCFVCVQAVAYFVLALLLDAYQRQALRLPMQLQLGLLRLGARLQPLWRPAAWRKSSRRQVLGAKGELSGAGTGSAVDAELELAGLQDGPDRSAAACLLGYSGVWQGSVAGSHAYAQRGF